MLPAGIVALGLVQGSLAGLNSLGMVLLWRTTRLVNLAQPALGMVGGVLTGLLVASAGWSFWWAAPVGIGIGALLGVAAERLVLIRLQDVPRAVLLVATVGLAQVFGALQTALPFAFGGALPAYTIDLGLTVDLFPVRLLGPHLLALASLPLTLLALHLFLHRSRFGLAACALGQDSERARALGVPAASVRTVVWAVAGAVGSVAGILAIPVLGFNLGGGASATVLLLALAPAVLAGLRSLVAAALAALALGVGYQACLWYAPSAGAADLLLAGSILVAVALQRRRLGRTEAASRASSWEAAATPRPLPWWVSRQTRVRVVGAVGFVVLLAGATLAPLLFSPSDDVLYATSASLVLAALAVAMAWMFAGEVVLGHWGLAGLGAATAAVAPGGWVPRSILAALAATATGAVFALAARRHSGLSFAVLGLAAAVAAPVLVLRVGRESVPADPETVAMVAGALVVLAALGAVYLRSSLVGARMVAARDDPMRAPWLGANPLRSRVLALAISSGLAGVAGSLYLAATPAGLAPGAFDPIRSLDLLAMAVVGGLGSPAGAVVGATALQLARIHLPGPWALVASGAGVLIVVTFLPAGLGRLLERARDRVVSLLQEHPPAAPPPPGAETGVETEKAKALA